MIKLLLLFLSKYFLFCWLRASLQTFLDSKGNVIGIIKKYLFLQKHLFFMQKITHMYHVQPLILPAQSTYIPNCIFVIVDLSNMQYLTWCFVFLDPVIAKKQRLLAAVTAGFSSSSSRGIWFQNYRSSIQHLSCPGAETYLCRSSSSVFSNPLL